MADTQINVGMNVDGVITGTEKAKRSLKDLGGAASEAGRSVGGMGDGGKQSADKVEQSTRSMINSIQRQIAATEAGDKSTRAYQESLARMRGIDAGALKPYLDQLDSAKSKAQLAGVASESFAASFAGIRNAAMIAAAAVGSFSVAFKKINDGVDALNDLKDATGASIENISALEDVALRSGASFDTVSTSLIKFNGILKDAKPGSDAANAMKALGLSVEDFKRLDPAEALRQTAVAMNAFADDGNKARLAQELFGKSLKDVAPFLKDLADQGKLVATVTTQQAEEAEKFNKELFQMQKNLGDAARSIVKEMIPALNELSREYMIARKNSISWFDAMLTQGLQNPFKTAGENAKAYSDELASLDKDRARFIKGGNDTSSIDAAIATLKRRQAYFLEVGRSVVAEESGNKPSAPDLPDTTAIKAAASAAKSAAAEANRELKEQAKLLAELSGLTGSFSEDWDRLSTIYKNGKLSLEGLTKAQADLLGKQPAIKAAKDAEAKAVEAATKAYQESEKEHARYIESLSKGVEKFTADTKAQQDRNDRLGLSKEAIADLDAAELELQATKLDGLAIDELVSKHDEIAYQSLVDQAAMLRKLAVLKSQGATKEAGLDYAKAAESNWKKSVEKYDDIFSKGFADMVSGGKDTWSSFTASLSTTFKTSVADQIYKTFAQPFVVKFVASMIGLTGSAVASDAGSDGSGGGIGGVTSALSAISGMKTAIGGSGWVTNFGGNVAASASSLGSSIGGDLGAEMMMNSEVIGATAKTFGDVLGYANAAYALSQGKYGEAAGAAIGTYFGGPIGSFIGSQIGKAVDNFFGAGLISTATMGASQGTYDATGKLTGSQAIDVGQTTAQIASAQVRADALANSYYKTAESMGIKAVAATFGFNSNTGEQGANPNVDFRVNAGSASYKSGEISATNSAGITLAISRAVITALQESELPKYLSGVLDGLTASTATQAQIDDTMKLAQSYKLLHDQLQAMPFEYLRDMSYKAAAGLVAAAGTMENLGSLLGGYYEAFYTAEEKKAQLTKNTTAAFEKLGIVMPVLDESARAWYRSEVDRLGAMDMSVAANASAYTSVLSLSGAMNTLVPVIDSTAKSATDATAALEKTNQGWQDKLALLAGAETDRSIALRDATDESTKAIMRQVYAQEDLKTAAEALSALLGNFASRLASDVANAEQALQAAKDGIRQAYDSESAAIKATQDRFTGIGKTFADFANGLAGALDTPAQSFERLRDEYTRLSDMARLGDADAATKAIGVGAQLKDSIIARSSTRVDAEREIAKLAASATTTAGIATTQASLAELSQQQLDAQVSGFIDLNASVLSVKDAIEKFQASQTTLDNLRNDYLRAVDMSLSSQSISATGGASAGAQSYSLKEVSTALIDYFAKGGKATDLATLAQNNYGISAGTLAGAAGTIAGTTPAGSDANSAATTAANAASTSAHRAKIIRDYIGQVQGTMPGPELASAIYSKAMQVGTTQAEIAAAIGWSTTAVKDFFAGAGIPQFAQGINNVPYDMTARIHEGEAVIPAAFNPFNPNAQKSGDTDRLERLVEALTAEVQGLRAEAQATAGHTSKTARLLDRAMPDGDALATRAAV